jgi:hypothetical protein
VARSGQDARQLVDGHAGEALQPDHLDHPQHLGLRVAQVHQPSGTAQAPSHDREVEDERAVGERQLAQIDDDVALAGKRAGESRASPPARRNILVSRAAQDGWLFGELDDG